MVSLNDKTIEGMVVLAHHGDQSYRSEARRLLSQWASEALAGVLKVSENGMRLLAPYLTTHPAK